MDWVELKFHSHWTLSIITWNIILRLLVTLLSLVMLSFVISLKLRFQFFNIKVWRSRSFCVHAKWLPDGPLLNGTHFKINAYGCNKGIYAIGLIDLLHRIITRFYCFIDFQRNTDISFRYGCQLHSQTCFKNHVFKPKLLKTESKEQCVNLQRY